MPEIGSMAGLKNAEWIVLALVLAVASALMTSNVQALAVSKPKMEDLNPTGKPWIPVRVGENTEFQMTIWGEDNTMVDIGVKIENENALGFASFDPENFTLTPGESKKVRCIFTPTATGIFKSSIVISESSPDNVSGNPILKSIAFDVEVHAELPSTTIELTKVTILLITTFVIVAVISLASLKLKSKRRDRRVLTHLDRVIFKFAPTSPTFELVLTPHSTVDNTKDNDNILAWERSIARGWI
jgi:hypothetical protein